MWVEYVCPIPCLLSLFSIISLCTESLCLFRWQRQSGLSVIDDDAFSALCFPWLLGQGCDGAAFPSFPLVHSWRQFLVWWSVFVLQNVPFLTESAKAKHHAVRREKEWWFLHENKRFRAAAHDPSEYVFTTASRFCQLQYLTSLR
jgi:hypothetical protein